MSTSSKNTRPGVTRRVLLLAGLIMSALLIIVFIRMRMEDRSHDIPEAPERTDAALTINQFHHTATQDGKTRWVLDAAKAELYADANTARLKDIQATFYTSDQGEIRLEANTGELNLSSKNMSVSGTIVVQYADGVLKTENLHYQHDSNIINANTRIALTRGKTRLEADSAILELDSGRAVFDGNVEGWVNTIEKF